MWSAGSEVTVLRWRLTVIGGCCIKRNRCSSHHHCHALDIVDHHSLRGLELLTLLNNFYSDSGICFTLFILILLFYNLLFLMNNELKQRRTERKWYRINTNFHIELKLIRKISCSRFWLSLVRIWCSSGCFCCRAGRENKWSKSWRGITLWDRILTFWLCQIQTNRVEMASADPTSCSALFRSLDIIVCAVCCSSALRCWFLIQFQRRYREILGTRHEGILSRPALHQPVHVHWLVLWSSCNW